MDTLVSVEQAAVDPEVASLVARGWHIGESIGDEKTMQKLRDADNEFDVRELERKYTLKHLEKTIQGTDGNSIILSIYRPMKPDVLSKRPGIYYIHGGGMTFGNLFYGLSTVLPVVRDNRAVCVTVEYRLAPEHRAPAALNDCYDGLKWVGEHLDELGIDENKLLIVGRSAGGALAAGTALLLRDKNEGPKLCGMMLNSPMLDDRSNTESSWFFKHSLYWTRKSNIFAWRQVLGENYDSANVSPYVAPARATNLSCLPPTFIDVGDMELLLDEATEFAEKLRNAGVEVELRRWERVFHCYDIMAPEVRKEILKARFEWINTMISTTLRHYYLLGI